MQPDEQPSGAKYFAVFTLQGKTNGGIRIVTDSNVITANPSSDRASLFDQAFALACERGKVSRNANVLFYSIEPMELPHTQNARNGVSDA